MTNATHLQTHQNDLTCLILATHQPKLIGVLERALRIMLARNPHFVPTPIQLHRYQRSSISQTLKNDLNRRYVAAGIVKEPQP